MLVDSDGMENGLACLENANNIVNKILIDLEKSKNGTSVKVSGYKEIKEEIEKEKENLLTIIDRCNEYIKDTTEAVTFMEGLTANLPGNKIDDAGLKMMAGPINPNLGKEYQKVAEKIRKNELRSELIKYGLTNEDIERILNNEISLDDLYQEILNDNTDSGKERYKRIEKEY